MLKKIRLFILFLPAFFGVFSYGHCEDSPQATSSVRQNPAETLELWEQIRNQKTAHAYLQKNPGEFRDIDNDLCAAAAKGDPEILDDLLTMGADPNAVDSLGVSALAHAVLAKKPQTVESLLKAGAKINNQGLFGVTPLMLAANTNSGEIFKTLLQNGGDPFLENDDGESAISIAKRKGYDEITVIIQDSVLDQDQVQPKAPQETKDINRALMQEIMANHTQKALEKLAHGADPNYRLEDGTTPLIAAAALGNRAVVQRLLQKKVEIDTRAAMGMSALMLAVQNRHLDIVELLLDRGADPYLKNDLGQNAYSIALSKSHSDTLQLLQRYADNGKAV